MFIYCGDVDSKRVRVLDTDDKVTEVVDKIQLKVLQSKGYTVKKNFSYDYAYNICRNLHECGFEYGTVSWDKEFTSAGQTMFRIYNEYNKCYGIGFSSDKLYGFRYHCFYNGDFGYILAFINNGRLYIIIIQEKGIFCHDMECDATYDKVAIDCYKSVDNQFCSAYMGNSKGTYKDTVEIMFDEFANVIEL